LDNGSLHPHTQSATGTHAIQGVCAVALAVSMSLGLMSVQVSTAQAADNCTVSAILVNSCRPWLGAAASKYPQASTGVKAQMLYHEQRIGRQVDIVHTYHAVGLNSLTADDKFFVARPDTHLFANWKPTASWRDAGGSNATVNGAIDQMALSVKSVAPAKIFLTLHHEPQGDVTSDPNCPYVVYKGTSGTPTEYQAMWRNVRNRFEAQGTTNVVWVIDYQNYAPFNCLTNDLYPGDDLVDWVMFNAYGNPKAPNYATNVNNMYNLLSANSNTNHNYLSKPWGIVEWNMRDATESEATSYYNQAKTALDNKTFPRLSAEMAFDSIGPDGYENRVAYVAGGAYSQIKQDAYTAYAQDPIFVTPQPHVDTTPPSTPGNLRAPSVGTGSVRLGWDSSSDDTGVAGYDLFRDGVPLATVGAVTGYTDSTVVAGTSYRYTIDAFDAAGNLSPVSGAVTVTTPDVQDISPPSVPGAPTASGVSESRVDLAWSASTDDVAVTQYTISRDGSVIGTSSGPSYSDTTVPANRTYSYVVSAQDAAGNTSADSAATSVTTPAAADNTAPTVPTGLRAAGTTQSRVDLTWTASDDAVGVTQYTIRRDGVDIGTSLGAAYTDTSVLPRTAYVYAVLAQDAAGNKSGYSTDATVTTPDVPDTTSPTTPTNLIARVVSPTKVALTWAASTDNVGVVGYTVVRDGTVSLPVSATSYTDTSMTSGQPHSYAVYARDQAGNSSPRSGSASVTVPAVAPSGLTGSYFDTASFTSLKVTRVDSRVAFGWGTAAPASGMGADTFSVRWTGKVIVPATGTYTFYTQSDDAVRLWVNGQQIVNDWTAHTLKEDKGAIALSANQAYSVKMEYYENTGQATAKLLWSGSGLTRQLIPASQLLAR
jgi:chitodextrinase